ncbi:hypothetical protein BZG36_01606 [Bifiguratus adelaidae]|uniref:SLC41A/MgtE integral membrane domain-containing protein n=1 Tax=Bifiguratus adelaidae TaxID=1938954 RepID=A0A261Y4G3_9FUNG|nr:hypothetical protein BZG36_01606 [Bifiguratus adelaidae]
MNKPSAPGSQGGIELFAIDAFSDTTADDAYHALSATPLPSSPPIHENDTAEGEAGESDQFDTYSLHATQYQEDHHDGDYATASTPLFHTSIDLERSNLLDHPEGTVKDVPELEMQSAWTLAIQTFPSTMILLGGLMFVGWLLDYLQAWPVFEAVPELYILVPILFNLKGNLEMNFAARLSTAANLGSLDQSKPRRKIVVGNSFLLILQALIVGSIAGLFSYLLGLSSRAATDPSPPIWESLLMVATSMMCASISGAFMSVFTSVLIIACRHYNVNPDNIACPIAACVGDNVTISLLAILATLMYQFFNTALSPILLVVMVLLIPILGRSVYLNDQVKGLLFSGWTPVFVAMLISSGAGVVLERFVEPYPAMALLVPVMNGISGNFGTIYCSRLSTYLHAGRQDNYMTVEWTMMLMNLLIQVLFLLVTFIFQSGNLEMTWTFVAVYLVSSMLLTYFALLAAKYGTLLSWRFDYDPDNYVLTYLTALVDVSGTGLLVLQFMLLHALESKA